MKKSSYLCFMRELENIYGHPCIRKYVTVKGSHAVEFVEINKLIAEKQSWYVKGKQVLFRDGNGLNLSPENLTQDWAEVKLATKRRPVIATVNGGPVVFDSIKTCGEYLKLKPLYISQALSRGTNIGGYFIEYYFETLPGAPIVRGVEKIRKDRQFKVEVDGIGFYKLKEAADYLDVLPSTLSIYFREGRTKIKGHQIKKL